MTHDAEFTDLVRTFLEDGSDRMPDRVYRGAMEVVPATRQARSPLLRWPVGRAAPVVRVATVAAALVIAGIGALSLLSYNAGIGTLPATATPSPTPTLAPTAVPTPTTVPGPSEIPIGGGDTHEFQAGTYRIPGPFLAPLRLTFTSPWTSSGLDPDGVFFYRSTPSAFAPTLHIDRAFRVFGDPCHPDPESALQSPPADLPTGDEIVAALQDLEGFTAGPVTDTTVGGHPARTFVLNNAITDAAAAACSGSPLDLWEGSFGRNVTNQRAQDHIWVVDVNGSPITIDAQTTPGVTGALQVAEVEALVASIQFDQ